MLNRQDVIKASNNAMSETFTALSFGQKEVIEKISYLLNSQQIQLEEK